MRIQKGWMLVLVVVMWGAVAPARSISESTRIPVYVEDDEGLFDVGCKKLYGPAWDHYAIEGLKVRRESFHVPQGECWSDIYVRDPAPTTNDPRRGYSVPGEGGWLHLRYTAEAQFKYSPPPEKKGDFHSDLTVYVETNGLVHVGILIDEDLIGLATVPDANIENQTGVTTIKEGGWCRLFILPAVEVPENYREEVDELVRRLQGTSDTTNACERPVFHGGDGWEHGSGGLYKMK